MADTPDVAGPHDLPSAAQLVEAVREWIERDVIQGTEGRLKFHARVAVNALAIVEREFALGDDQRTTHAGRLERFGVADDVELAAAIRRREFDHRAVELRRMIVDTVIDKLLVANPSYLAAAPLSVEGGAGSA